MVDINTSDPWTAYWANNTTGNSFKEQGKDTWSNYGQDVEEFWKSILNSCKNNVRIVDLATGNGALLQIATKINNDKSKTWELIGVDMAKVSPNPNLLDSVKFYEKTSMEALPFENESVDVIISQYGFEYGERLAVLKQITRVLKLSGSFISVSHHKGSYVTQISQLMYRFYEDLRQNGVFDLLNSQLNANSFKKFQNELMMAMKPLVNKYSSSEIKNDVLNLMQSIGKLITSVNQVSFKVVDNSLSRLSNETQLHFFRLKQQIEASLDEDDIADIQKLAFKNDLAFQASEKQFADGELVWVIKINKNG